MATASVADNGARWREDPANAGVTPFGALVPLTPKFVASGDSPVALVIHPNGRFVYVANALDDYVTSYSVDQNTGALTKGFELGLGQFGLGVGEHPTALAIDSDGNNLYVVCYGTSEIERHSINLQNGGWLANPTIVKTPASNPLRLTTVP